MAIKFSNLASTTLASGVSDTATSISVTSASSFPSLGGGDYFYASIGIGSGSEVVKVTAVSGTTFTVVRGQDDTTAISHASDVEVALRVTAASLNDLSTQADTESVSRAGDSMTGDLSFGDNDKATFGASDDLQIYHDGSNSFIKDIGTGDLRIDAGEATIVSANSGILNLYSSDYRIEAGAAFGDFRITAPRFRIFEDGNVNFQVDGGVVDLRYAGSSKLATTSTGIDVTGTATMDGLTVDGDGLIQASTGAKLEIKSTTNFISPNDVVGSLDFVSADYNHTAQPIKGQIRSVATHPSGTGDSALFLSTTETTNLKDRIKIDYNGNISFYDTNGTTASFVYDASAGLTINEASADRDFRVESDSNAHALFVDGGTGNVGINDNAPSGLSGATVLNVTGSTGAHGQVVVEGDNGTQFLVSNSGISTTNVSSLYANTGIRFATATNKDATGFTERLAISTSGVVANEYGVDADFRVESDTNTHALFVDASANRVGIGRSGLTGGSANTVIEGTVQIADTFGHVPLFLEGGASYAGFKIQRGAPNISGGMDAWNLTVRPSYFAGVASGGDISLLKAVTPYGGQHAAVINEDSYDLDFRVESDSNANAFKVDAALNLVGIGVAPSNSFRALTVDSASESTAVHVHGENAGIYIGTSYTGGFADNAAIARAQVGSYHVSGSSAGDLCIAPERYKDLVFGSTNASSGANAKRAKISAGGSLITYSGAVFNEDGNDKDFRVETDSNSSALFVDSTTSQIGLGTSSPQKNLHLRGGTPQYLLFENYVNGHSAGDVSGGLLFMNGDDSTPSGDRITASIKAVAADAFGRQDLAFYAGHTNSKTAYGGAADYTDETVERLRITAYDGIIANDNSNDVNFRVESNDSSHMLFVEGGTNRVGINNNDPSSVLHISGTYGDTGFIRMSGGAQEHYWYLEDAVNSVFNIGTGSLGAGFDFRTNNVSKFKVGVSASTFSTNITLNQATTFPTTGFISHPNGYLYAEGGSNGIILRDASGSTQMMFLTASEVVVNNDSEDMNFRVESNNNANMLFVDGGNDKVVMGSSSSPVVSGSSTRTYDLVLDKGVAIGNSPYTHGYIGTDGTDGNVVIAANSYAANLGASRYVKIMGGTAGGGGPTSIAEFNGDTGAVFNEGGLDIDFRVESDNNAHALFVDGESGNIAINNTTASARLDIREDTGYALRLENQNGWFVRAKHDLTEFGNKVELAAIAESKSVTAKDVFVYDTSKDSDGGAWRHRTQGTSWYNEALNTSTRGATKKFPAVAVIVAESNKVTIYDGDDPAMPMWMVFNGGTNIGYSFAGFSPSSRAHSSIVMLNGVMATGGSAAGYLTTCSFLDEKGVVYLAGSNGVHVLRANIVDRNDTFIYTTNLGNANVIVNASVNDVAMTVLPNAPIDADTGLPVPTIAVATNGGVNVIKDDGSVHSLSGGAIEIISINDRHEFITTPTNSSDTIVIKPLSTSDTNLNWNTGIRGYSWNPATALYPFLSFRQLHTVATPEGFNFVRNANDGGGLTFMSEDFTNARKTLQAVITSDYNTGWMNGDIKLATLSDTDDTNVTGSELVTNGDFASTDLSDWSEIEIGSGTATFNVTSGALRINLGGSYDSGVGQQLTTVAGQTYTLSFDISFVTNFNAANAVQFSVGTSLNNTNLGYSTLTSDGTYTLTFTATGTTAWVSIRSASSANTTGEYSLDNISVRLAEEDRSVNGKGLQVIGTVAKSAVATGADLVGYGGFTSNNYLEQPYNSDLNFGTGDFCFMAWLNNTNCDSSNQTIFSRDDGPSALSIRLAYPTGYPLVVLTQSGVSDSLSSAVSFEGGAWKLLTVTRKSGVVSVYVDGALAGTVSSTKNISSSTAVSKVGIDRTLNNAYRALQTKIALLRISATAPTADQIAKMYRDEKPLFQENAKATLYGTSDSVPALAYDDDTELLHAGTSAGRSVFQGLRRVDNTTDAVGVAISASNDLIVEE